MWRIQEKVAAEVAQTLKQYEDGHDQSSEKNPCVDEKEIKELSPEQHKKKAAMKTQGIAVEFSGKQSEPQKNSSEKALALTPSHNEVQETFTDIVLQITKPDDEKHSVVSVRKLSWSSLSSSSILHDDTSTSTSDNQAEM